MMARRYQDAFTVVPDHLTLEKIMHVCGCEDRMIEVSSAPSHGGLEGLKLPPDWTLPMTIYKRHGG
jgi:hypothetical protein